MGLVWLQRLSIVPISLMVVSTEVLSVYDRAPESSGSHVEEDVVSTPIVAMEMNVPTAMRVASS
eukprot:481049-Prymnesium_polylepis.1